MRYIHLRGIWLMFLTFSAGAQSVSVTSPANNAVMSGPFNLTAALANAPAVTRVEFYIDGRFECVAAYQRGGAWSCPFAHPTFSDYAYVTVYAVAKDALGAVAATSATNTFNIRNHGLNATSSFTAGGSPVANGGIVNGSLVWTYGANAATVDPGVSFQFAIDGLQFNGFGPVQRMNVTNINTSTGQITVPGTIWYTGQQVFVSCAQLNNNGLSCGTSPGNLPSGYYYAIALDGNHIKLASSRANALAGINISITSQGGPGMLQVSAAAGLWGSGNNPVSIDTTYFPNGLHRLENTVTSPYSGTNPASPPANYPPPCTQTFTAANVNIGTNSITLNNHPFIQNQSVTITNSGGALPAGITSPATIDVVDQNTFRFHGQTVVNPGSGTQIVSFRPDVSSWSNSFVYPVLGTAVTRIDFENGAAPMALRMNYSRLFVTNGETVNLVARLVNTDGSTTALTQSSLIWGTSDASIASVSSSGLVTGGSTRGEALISVLDPASKRWTQVVVQQVPDHVTFKHFSKDSGILSTYDSSHSRYLTTMFSVPVNQVLNAPYPYTEPGAWWKWSGFNTLNGGLDFSWIDNAYPDFASWQSWFNGPADMLYFPTRVASVAQFASTYGVSMQATLDTICSNGWLHPKNMLSTAWKRQAYSYMMNAVAPYVVGVDACDEMDTRTGTLAKPNGTLGSNNDGLGGPGGYSSIVVTGCPSLPCVGTGTVATATYQDFNFSTGFTEISSATTANLNGPYTATNIVHDWNQPHGSYLTSFQIQTLDVPNGTYNSTTDPNLTFTKNTYCYGVPCLISQTYIQSIGPFTQIVISGTQGTIAWTGHGVVQNQSLYLSGFTTANLNGYYRADVVDANTIHIRTVNVANGTYNQSTDSGGSIQPLIYPPFPDSFVTNFMNTWMTGAHPNLAAPTVGNASLQARISYQGDATLAQYNSIYFAIPPGFDRDGYLTPALKDVYDASLDLANFTQPSNFQLYKDAPDLFLSALGNLLCAKVMTQSYDCTPGDGHMGQGSGSAPHAFIAAFYPQAWGAAGTRGYGADSWGTKYASYESNVSPASPLYGFDPGADYVDVNTDNWMANAEAQIFADHLQKYILAPVANAPDYGPEVYSGVRKIPGNGGTLHMLGSWSDETQTVNVDLSQFELGGPVRRYTITPRGMRVDSLPSNQSADTISLRYGGAVAYAFQPAGAADELTFYNFHFNPASLGASKVALEIHYYPKDDPITVFDCSSSCTVPLDLNGIITPVWYRYFYLASGGAVLFESDVQRFR